MLHCGRLSLRTWRAEEMRCGDYWRLLRLTAPVGNFVLKCSIVGGNPLDGAFFEGLWVSHLGRLGCATWDGLVLRCSTMGGCPLDGAFFERLWLPQGTYGAFFKGLWYPASGDFDSLP
ncbi:hypothetical protein JCGZ_10416 [Jatropha curcas]|uniref:Uncharacterized protein n=1 Tax=Jatropha curcas TaxID=180498 RepID=A0A067KU44_JATCU|nr:hypothetical protein JCGZ_10416 [Jatropha curcas]